MIQFSQQAFRTLRGLAVIALTAGLMIGCGGDEEAAEPAGDDTASSAPKPAAPSGSGAPKAGGDAGSSQAANSGGSAAPGNGRQVMGAGGSAPTPGNGRQVMGSGGSVPGNGRQVMGSGGSVPGNGRQVMGSGGSIPGAGPSGGNAAQAGPPPEPPRSTDFAAWSVTDFKDAVRERDAAVVDAIKWLAENKQDNDSAKLLVELLTISQEPAKKPPAGIRGGRPGGPGGPGRQPAGGGGGNILTGSLDKSDVFNMISVVLNTRFSTLSATTMFMQNGPPQGNGGNPYGGMNGGNQTGGPPPPGQGGNPYGGMNTGGGQSGGPPPPGADGNPYGGMNTGGGQGGPPPPGADGNPYGGMNGGGSSGVGGPPPPGAGGNPYGGSGGGGTGLGAPGLGGNRGLGASANAGSYAHYGTLDMNLFVKTTISSLMKIDAPQGWDAIEGLLDGSMSTSMGADETSELILTSLLENYGGVGDVSHRMLMKIVDSDSPQATKAMELFTDYAGTAIDQLMGLVEPATEGGAADSGSNGQPGNGRSIAGFGGGNGRSIAGFGGGNGRSLAGPGGGNGRSLAGPGGGNGRSLAGPGGGGSGVAGFGPGGGNGGGNAPAARKSISLSMASNVRPMTEDQLEKVTGFLWHPDFNQAVARRLENGPLVENSQLLALVGSLPTQIAREAQYKVLSGNQKDGADSFVNAGFFGRIAKDPAVMVALKSMSQQKRAPGSAQSSWDEATKLAALALRDRLRTAADSLGQGSMPSPSPVRLHKGAEVETVFRAKWPNDISSEIGSSKPGFTDVLYVRMPVAGDNITLKKLSRHYEARISANKKIEESMRVDASRQIVWYSGSRTLKTGVKRSMDVVFSQDRTRNNNGFGGGGNGRNLGGTGGGGASGGAIIELIVVDTPNPKSTVANASLDK
ncbi:MAG: hypothetical protein AB8G99_02845 [Planctomycetaceae bacterium]